MIVKILDLQKEKYHHKIMTKKQFNKVEYGDIVLYGFNKLCVVNRVDKKNKIIIKINNN